MRITNTPIRRSLAAIACALLLLAGFGRGAAQGQPSQLLLKDIKPGAEGSDPFAVVSAGDLAYFTVMAATGASRELWVTDGTTEGTKRIIELPFGPNRSMFTPMKGFNGRLLFLRYVSGGSELRSSDGTGTALIAALPGQYPGSAIATADGVAYFATNNGGLTHQVWRTDGTPANTASLTQLQGQGVTSSATPFVVGGRLYVSFYDGNGRAGGVAYKYFDGAGLIDLNGCFDSGASLNCTGATAFGDRLAVGVNNPPALRFYQGAISETLGLSPLLIGDLRLLRSAGPLLFFSEIDADHRMWLWRTDGTLAGTQRLRQFGTWSDSIRAPVAAHGALYFEFAPYPQPAQLWQTDGTPAGTRQVTGPAPNGFTSASLAGTADGRLLFFADDGIHGAELWQIASRDAAPTLVHDVEPGPGSSAVTTFAGQPEVAALRGGLFWLARDSAAGAEPRYLAPGFAPYARPAWGGGQSGGLATAPLILGNRGAASQPVTLTLNLPAGVSLAGHTLAANPIIEGGTARWRLDGLATGEQPARLTFRLPAAPLGTSFTATLSLEPGGASAPIRLEIARQLYLPLVGQPGSGGAPRR